MLAALDRAVEVSGNKSRRCELTFEAFVKKFPIAPDYIWGAHTHAIAAELQAANDAVESGGTYYACISVPPRHGKSDLVSRRFAPYFLARNPDSEVMLVTYASNLSEDLSHSARKCFELAGKTYGLKLSEDRNQIGAWMIEGHRGGMFSIGLGGSATGRGAAVLLIDDFIKNRSEAESEMIRDSGWESFRSDLMTRLAPSHAVVIVGTPWHEDDMFGRIKKEMAVNPKFPRFKFLKFPAWTDTAGWLFPERFPAEWYEAQRAAVGAYAWESLYQCNPTPRTGRMFRADLVRIIKPDQVPKGLRPVRAWDLASTEKERVKDDPDFTAGPSTAWDGPDLYILDVKRGQWGATQRDKVILETAQKDGRGVLVKIETVAGYKDTYIRVRDLLRGYAIVKNSIPKGDKVSRASILEPTFEAGRVFLVEGPWNADWIAEFTAFPKGKHDDQVDGTVISATEGLERKKGFGMSVRRG